MGHKLKRINLKVKENEQININTQMKKEKRSLIHGVVFDEYKEPIPDAAVLMFRRDDYEECNLRPIASAFTDKCGQFVFGPLEAEMDVVIKIWVNGTFMVDIYR